MDIFENDVWGLGGQPPAEKKKKNSNRLRGGDANILTGGGLLGRPVLEGKKKRPLISKAVDRRLVFVRVGATLSPATL